ncbi:hypothetical protein NW765_010921 [Fusarium oxysporum]|nr:hypothetical protein NW765_010921 [Fusarium oxysporum]
MTYPFPYSQAAKLDSRIKIPRPTYDPDLAPLLDSASFPEEFDLNLMRGVASGEQECSHGSFIFNAETVLKDNPHLSHTEHSIPGPDNNIITLDRLRCCLRGTPPRSRDARPGPAEDCYAGLVWVSENASSLGIDPAAIVVFGVSGGGALAAATCLMARDRKRPAIPIKAQMLYSPLLDDRCESLADQQFEYGNPASTAWLRAIWDLILGDARGSENVTPYQAPARETDLSNLPAAYIDAGECEVFRDVAVAYATKMWRGGSTCELHIWPGAWHGFDMMDDPNMPLIHVANMAKANWLQRVMRSVKDE